MRKHFFRPGQEAHGPAMLQLSMGPIFEKVSLVVS